jgi:RHS repeat-associated protein
VREGGIGETTLNYTGQKLDGTGLLFYNARYYDPNLGKFVSADTIVPNPANPQTFNRYAYVYNNPLRYRDPSGHCPSCNMHDSGGGGGGDEQVEEQVQPQEEQQQESAGPRYTATDRAKEHILDEHSPYRPDKHDPYAIVKDEFEEITGDKDIDEAIYIDEVEEAANDPDGIWDTSGIRDKVYSPAKDITVVIANPEDESAWEYDENGNVVGGGIYTGFPGNGIFLSSEPLLKNNDPVVFTPPIQNDNPLIFTPPNTTNSTPIFTSPNYVFGPFIFTNPYGVGGTRY